MALLTLVALPYFLERKPKNGPEFAIELGGCPTFTGYNILVWCPWVKVEYGFGIPLPLPPKPDPIAKVHWMQIQTVEGFARYGSGNPLNQLWMDFLPRWSDPREWAYNLGEYPLVGVHPDSRMCSRGTDELYAVKGMDLSETTQYDESNLHEVVIHRFDATPSTGSFSIAFGRAEVPFGVPAPAFSAKIWLNGDRYILPTERVPPTFQRTEIYRGELPGRVCAIACEPQGRCLILLTVRGEIWGMPLGENPVPERWYSMNQCAGSFVNSLQYRVTEAGQNLLFVSYGYPAEMEFEFIDLDNDGDLRDQIRIMPERYEEDGEPTFNPSRSTVSLELRR
ncbi:MAG: hypothetical protein R3F33_15145 [Planctomycetota bacterium]